MPRQRARVDGDGQRIEAERCAVAGKRRLQFAGKGVRGIMHFEDADFQRVQAHGERQAQTCRQRDGRRIFRPQQLDTGDLQRVNFQQAAEQRHRAPRDFKIVENIAIHAGGNMQTLQSQRPGQASARAFDARLPAAVALQHRGSPGQAAFGEQQPARQGGKQGAK